MTEQAEGLVESVKRLEAEHARLVFKARNLQQRGKIVMARQEQATADALRTVLDAMKEKTAENTMWQTQCQIAVAGRKSAEAALREAQALAAHNKECTEATLKSWHEAEAVLREAQEAVLKVRKKLERFVDSEGYGVVGAANVIEWLDKALAGESA